MRTKILGLLAVGMLAGPLAANASPVAVDISAFSGTALDIDAAAGSLLTNQFLGNGLVISGGASAYDDASVFGFPPEAGAIKGSSITQSPFAISDRITFAFSSQTNLFGGYFTWNPTRLLRFDIGLGSADLGSISFVNDRVDAQAVFVGISNLTPFDRVVITALLPDGSVGRTSFLFDLLRFQASPTTEVPESGTLALLGLGLAGLVLSRRRKAA